MGFWDRLRDAAGAYGLPGEGSPAPRSPRERALVAELQDRPASDPVRLHLRFTGDVQGVGFRWTNQGLARERGLSGWVRNLDDGSVGMEVQGPPLAIVAHLDRVHAYYRRFGNRIWLETARDVPVLPGEGAFEVRG